MMLTLLGRPRVAILMKGLLYVPYKESVEETKVTLAREMHEQGITIDMKRL